MLAHHRRSVLLAAASVLAGVGVVLSVFQAFPVLGVQGASIGIAAIMPPLSGIILGPYAGALAVFVSGLIGSFIAPYNAPFGVLTFIPGVVGALSAGFLTEGKWVRSLAIFLAGIALFLLYPGSASYAHFVWFHLIGCVLLISPLHRIAVEGIRGGGTGRTTIAVAVVSLISTLSDQVSGSALAQVYFPLVLGFSIPAEIWQSVVFIYPVERLVITIIATIIGTGVVRALRSSGLTARKTI
jgi:hypothetical protein